MTSMANITLTYPEQYEKCIQMLIAKKILNSRSEAIRIAIGEFLEREFKENLPLIGFEIDNIKNSKEVY